MVIDPNQPLSMSEIAWLVGHGTASLAQVPLRGSFADLAQEQGLRAAAWAALETLNVAYHSASSVAAQRQLVFGTLAVRARALAAREFEATDAQAWLAEFMRIVRPRGVTVGSA